MPCAPCMPCALFAHVARKASAWAQGVAEERPHTTLCSASVHAPLAIWPIRRGPRGPFVLIAIGCRLLLESGPSLALLAPWRPRFVVWLAVMCVLSLSDVALVAPNSSWAMWVQPAKAIIVQKYRFYVVAFVMRIALVGRRSPWARFFLAALAKPRVPRLAGDHECEQLGPAASGGALFLVCLVALVGPFARTCLFVRAPIVERLVQALP